MKKLIKCTALSAAFVMIITSFSGCAKADYVFNGAVKAIQEINDGSWLEEQTAEESTEENAVVIAPFQAGTYGSLEFKTQDDVVNYYTECYNNTKAQTANYIDKDGNVQEYYALVGEEKLSVDEIYVDGKKNEMLNKTVPAIAQSAFAKGVYGLPPSNNRDPAMDNDNMEAGNPGKYDYTKSYFTPEHCLACNVTDNNDGTIKIVIQPKAASMSYRGADSQGAFFEVLKDLESAVDGIFTSYDMVSWASGTTKENCTVNYSGGTGEVVIDTKTNTIISADYHMKVFVEIKHANITVIKDKSGALYISHYIHYPASDDYLMEGKGLTRQK